MQRVFCRINLRVALCSEAKGWESRSRSESEPQPGVELHGADPKPM